MSRQSGEPERVLTVRDWKALYLVMRLAEQIVRHGADALDVFLAATSKDGSNG